MPLREEEARGRSLDYALYSGYVYIYKCIYTFIYATVLYTERVYLVHLPRGCKTEHYYPSTPLPETVWKQG